MPNPSVCMLGVGTDGKVFKLPSDLRPQATEWVRVDQLHDLPAVPADQEGEGGAVGAQVAREVINLIDSDGND